MLLSGTIGLLSVRSLMRNGTLWPSTALASAFTVTWLASWATTLVPQRWLRWAVLALTLTLLIIAVSRPSLLIGPDA